MPEKLWRVCPPRLVAEIPVEEVTATVKPCSMSALMMECSRYDLPVPAAPVKKKLSLWGGWRQASRAGGGERGQLAEKKEQV